jgi:hypothetical protein
MVGKKTLGNIVLFHWHAEEAEELAASLRGEGWHVHVEEVRIEKLKADPPVAVLISLRRLPSHGHQVADALWHTKWGRAIPIIFFDGTSDRVDTTRKKFPAATFTTWEELPILLLRIARNEVNKNSGFVAISDV